MKEESAEMTSVDEIARVLADARLLPVIRVATADRALELADRLQSAGLPVLELTATTPGWADALRRLRRRSPDVLVGAGTVATSADAAAAVDAGAQFLVSPYPAPDVRPVAARAGIPFIEGGYTPGEIAAAAAQGLAKLFPAHVGGPAFLRSVLAVLPGARIVPTGGIALDDAGRWLTAGALAVGVGSDLTAPGDIAARVERIREELQ